MATKSKMTTADAIATMKATAADIGSGTGTAERSEFKYLKDGIAWVNAGLIGDKTGFDAKAFVDTYVEGRFPDPADRWTGDTYKNKAAQFNQVFKLGSMHHAQRKGGKDSYVDRLMDTILPETKAGLKAANGKATFHSRFEQTVNMARELLKIGEDAAVQTLTGEQLEKIVLRSHGGKAEAKTPLDQMADLVAKMQKLAVGTPKKPAPLPAFANVYDATARVLMTELAKEKKPEPAPAPVVTPSAPAAFSPDMLAAFTAFMAAQSNGAAN